MSRIDVQQNKVRATAVKAVGGQVHLLWSREVDEAGAGERLGSKLTVNLGG